MYGCHQQLQLEEIAVPAIAPDQVLAKVGGAGMCRSDVQLIGGYFAEALKPAFPITLGHEIAGLVSAIGEQVPASAQFAIGDQVVVPAGWGDSICHQCRAGNEQLCDHGSWPGFGPPGGYAEFIPVPYRQPIRVDHRVKWEELAPLTDVGATPYRAIKNLRAAGVLGPDRVIGVFGASDLGSPIAVAEAGLAAFGKGEEIAAPAVADGKAATDVRASSLIRPPGKIHVCHSAHLQLSGDPPSHPCL
jgi:propanol-preferring alcohol dehydrogenase